MPYPVVKSRLTTPILPRSLANVGKKNRAVQILPRLSARIPFGTFRALMDKGSQTVLTQDRCLEVVKPFDCANGLLNTPAKIFPKRVSGEV